MLDPFVSGMPTVVRVGDGVIGLRIAPNAIRPLNTTATATNAITTRNQRAFIVRIRVRGLGRSVHRRGASGMGLRVEQYTGLEPLFARPPHSGQAADIYLPGMKKVLVVAVLLAG